MQMELQQRSEFRDIKDPQFRKLGIQVTLMGVPTSIGDVVLYNNSEERKTLEKEYPHVASIDVCLEDKEPRRTLAWYKDCLTTAAETYTKEPFRYNFVTNNCGHFAEKVLNKCGLANCHDYPKSNGISHRKGTLD